MTVSASGIGTSAIEQSVRRVLAEPRQPWPIYIAGEAATIRPLTPDIAVERIEKAVAIRAMVADSPATLRVPAETLRLLVEKLEPLANWEQLSSQARAGMLEYLLAEGIEAVESQSGSRVELVTVEDAEDAVKPANFGFEITWKGISVPVAAHLQEEMLHELAFWAGKLPRRPLRGLTVSIAIRRGYAVLTSDELKGLAPGDGIPIDPSVAESTVAVTGERYLAQCRLEADRAVLTENLLNRPIGPMRHLMNNEAVDQELQNSPLPSTVADIPIKLVFDVGRIEMPLGELEAIGEGYIFPLDRAQTDVVDIVAQGRIIGRGEIVMLDGFAAVRVTSLTG